MLIVTVPPSPLTHVTRPLILTYDAAIVVGFDETIKDDDEK